MGWNGKERTLPKKGETSEQNVPHKKNMPQQKMHRIHPRNKKRRGPIMHQYTCRFCNKIACNLSSFQELTPSGRTGFDLYECENCGVRYILDSNHKPQVTRKSYSQLSSEHHKIILDRIAHPEKYKKELKAYQEQQKKFKNSKHYKMFKKAFNEGLKECEE